MDISIISDILKILSKSSQLSFRDYIYVLDNTKNLKTIFLQELCNNSVFLNYQPSDIKDLLKIIRDISYESILNCIKTNDVYRLILINLKINDMITSVQPNMPVFKRSLTNGVYSSESINIYVNNEQKTVKEIINLYFKNIKISNEDDIYKNFVERSKPILTENINNTRTEFNLLIFSIISTISLFDFF